MLNIGFLLKQIKRHSDIFVLERAGDAKKWNDVKKKPQPFRAAALKFKLWSFIFWQILVGC